MIYESTVQERIAIPAGEYHRVIKEQLQAVFNMMAIKEQYVALQAIMQIGMQVQIHMFFTNASQDYFESVIFEDKSKVETLYAIVTRLKYALEVDGLSYDDLVEMVSMCGSTRENAETFTDSDEQKESVNTDVTRVQAIFNNAYVTSQEYRKRILTEYEWSLALFLIAFYIDDVIVYIKDVLPNE